MKSSTVSALLRRSLVLLLSLGFASGCQLVPSAPTTSYAPPAQLVHAASWSEVLRNPTEPLALFSVVAADWSVPSRGLINLDHPKARAAGLSNVEHPISVLTHVIRHPTMGDFLIDTGIDQGLADGDPQAIKGLVRPFLKDMRPRESLGATIAKHQLKLTALLLTHAHLDHVLGLPDLPLDVPIYTGKGELHTRAGANGLLRRTYSALFAGHNDIREFTAQTTIEGLSVVDILGDGSIWAILCPGHTQGSVAYLVNAASGPVLFTGDTSHTRWGWEHGVEPGRYSSDRLANRRSLLALKNLVTQHPQIRVVVGHELSPMP